MALLCRETARQGGNTSLASSWAIFNKMAESHPEELESLMRSDWPIQTYGQAQNNAVDPVPSFSDLRNLTD